MKRAFAVVAAGLLALTGCSEVTEAGESAESGDFMSITDPWLKATEDGAHMTGVFGVLSNDSDEEIHLVTVTSPVTERVEYHEMVGEAGSMTMAEMPDGITIPAGEEFVLEPGGNHIMLMELMEPIEAGETVEFTLETEDGQTFTFEAEARTYAGANEEYEGDDGMEGGDSMDGESGEPMHGEMSDGATDEESATN